MELLDIPYPIGLQIFAQSFLMQSLFVCSLFLKCSAVLADIFYSRSQYEKKITQIHPRQMVTHSISSSSPTSVIQKSNFFHFVFFDSIVVVRDDPINGVSYPADQLDLS